MDRYNKQQVGVGYKRITIITYIKFENNGDHLQIYDWFVFSFKYTSLIISNLNLFLTKCTYLPEAMGINK